MLILNILRGLPQGGGRQFDQRTANDCNTARQWYADQQEQRQFLKDGQRVPRYARQDGYILRYKPMDSVDAYNTIQTNQMSYLKDLVARVNHRPSTQIVP